ncbi:MAG TPA: lysophospholipid acyltransferase family protein [Anaeromyxobacteraceae bacterium]|nr:lysophospholipid acyltransferase family protein [Anaeromyxobacteraceae bacterium]
MRRFLRFLLEGLGGLLWLLGVRRGVVMDNLRLAFPEWTEPRRREVGRAVFRNLGRVAADFLFATRLTPRELDGLFVYEPGTLERILEARAAGKNVVVCTAHFGNFENLAAVHNLKGIPIAMITRRMGGGWLADLWRRGRSRAGVQDIVVSRGQTLQAALRAMRAGRVLGYVIDQNMSPRRAIFPTFFGVPAATSPTPAYLALRSKAEVFFLLDVPLEDGRHRVVIEGPLRMPHTGDRERDVLAFTQGLNDRLERWVREYPEQWYWVHRRWKTRPPTREGARSSGRAGGTATTGGDDAPH